MTNSKITVAEYLARRLEQMGVRRFFGVPGNHLGPFISIMDEKTEIKWNGGTNEINIGYAADGYAREKGISAVGVTFGVGALSLINTVSGAYVERVPMVVINASPPYETILNFRNVGVLTSHMSENELSNISAYRQVTANSQQITNSQIAAQQIDNALSVCIAQRQPVYLEIYENVFSELIEPPVGEIEQALPVGNSSNTEKAVAATIDFMKTCQRPIVWVGNEVSRQGLQQHFLALAEEKNIPFCSTIMGKTVVSEGHPLFHGVYNGRASDPDVWDVFKNKANCRIGIGAWSTSKNLGGTQNVGVDWTMAARNGVTVGTQYFPNVMLRDYIALLHEAIQQLPDDAIDIPQDYYALKVAQTSPVKGEPVPSAVASRADKFTPPTLSKVPDATLTYDNFFEAMNGYLHSNDHIQNHFVVSDAGFSLLGSQTLFMPRQSSFYSQASWLSIGYSVGASVGLHLARDETKPGEQGLTFVGDGSFQVTAQALSDLARTRLRHIVFVMNNQDFYGIEQMLVDACFFRHEADADIYNEIHPWQYEKLPEVFDQQGYPCHGAKVTTTAELTALLAQRQDPQSDIYHGTLLVRVLLNRDDFPKAIQYKVDDKEGKC